MSNDSIPRRVRLATQLRHTIGVGGADVIATVTADDVDIIQAMISSLVPPGRSTGDNPDLVTTAHRLSRDLDMRLGAGIGLSPQVPTAGITSQECTLVHTVYTTITGDGPGAPEWVAVLHRLDQAVGKAQLDTVLADQSTTGVPGPRLI